MTALAPFAGLTGSRSPRAIFIAEAWGEREVLLQRPLVGESGKEFTRMLMEAMPAVSPELASTTLAKLYFGDDWLAPREQWLIEAKIALTNVFTLRPTNNKLESLCLRKGELAGDYPPGLPHLAQGQWLDPQYFDEIDRLKVEIETLKPNLLVALGATATWALLRTGAIGSIRGAITLANSHPRFAIPQIKVLPTYHPAGVLRQWKWRPIVVADLMKAAREMEFWEIRRPERRIIINPSFGEVMSWAKFVLESPTTTPLLSVDCETEKGQIKCIGFARSRRDALVIPFLDYTAPGNSYWPDWRQEAGVWDAVRALLESPIPKLFQNGMYDLQYIVKYDIRPRALVHDTMLLHHSMFPEMQKGLGFLGSIYTNESSWKLLRLRKADTEKRDE